MLKQVVVQGANPRTFNIEDVDPNEILLLQSISGLTSTDVTLFTGDYARDGGYYQGRRATKLNPVFSIKMNPDFKSDIIVSDLREMLYQIFHEPQAGSDAVQVILKDDRKPDRYFYGYTEHVDADHFEKTRKAQVSMITVDPYLRSVNQTTASDATGWVSTSITYDGSAKTGLEVTLKVKTATTQIVLDIGGVTMTLVRSAGFAVNDTIYINTIQGQRAIKLNGVDVMAALTPASKWLQLSNGVNAIKTYATASGDGKVAIMNYTFRSAWWGV